MTNIMAAWDHWVSTDVGKKMMEKVLKKELTAPDIVVIFSQGMRYGHLKLKKPR